jgi:hypothetical protein
LLENLRGLGSILRHVTRGALNGLVLGTRQKYCSLVRFFFREPPPPAPRCISTFRIPEKTFRNFFGTFFATWGRGAGVFGKLFGTQWAILLTSAEAFSPPNRVRGGPWIFSKKSRPQAAECAATEFNAVFSTFFAIPVSGPAGPCRSTTRGPVYDTGPRVQKN